MINFLLIFSNFGIAVLRIILGVIMIYHGLPKIKNFKKMVPEFEKMGFHPGSFWLLIVALLEFIGGIFLVFGFLVQIVSLLLVIQFLVIILKLKKGNFSQMEFDLLILGTALALIFLGAGALSVDRIFFAF